MKGRAVVVANHKHQFTHRHDGEHGNCLVSGFGVEHCPDWPGIKDESCEVCGKAVHHGPPPHDFKPMTRSQRRVAVVRQ